MGHTEQYIEKWKKKLLDLGKRNKLIAYHETKRSSLKITLPSMEELYNKIVQNGDTLEFVDVLEDDEFPEQIAEKQVLTDRTKEDQYKTLLSIRNKAKTAVDEQGVNILYIAFGFLDWTESEHSDQHFLSPIVLVPVSITVESITSPFKLTLYEDDVVVNPTLCFKLENDYGINLPSFEDSEELSISDYLDAIENIVFVNGWSIKKEAQLSLFSFLKINMYKDLDKNRDKLQNNPIIKGFTGDKSEIRALPEEYDNYDFDSNERPVDIFQVVDADSSQQDAILYAKNGISFVLQGPPGTGKSQTITNIISECLSEGKKVLFVSEKMAALEVVYNRLKEVGLSDFCLRLHSHKANKKDVLSELGRTLNMNRLTVKDEAMYELELLQNERQKLNQYDAQLHEVCKPLGQSIYSISGRLSKLTDVAEIIFNINSVAETTVEKLNSYKLLLSELSYSIGKMSSDYDCNPWKGCTVKAVTHELRHDIEMNLKSLKAKLDALYDTYKKATEEFGLDLESSLDSVSKTIEILQVSGRSVGIPVSWIYESDIEPLVNDAAKYKILKAEHDKLQNDLLVHYSENVFEIPANETLQTLSNNTTTSLSLLNPETYCNLDSILTHKDKIHTDMDLIVNTIEKFKNAFMNLETLLGISKPNNILETQNVLKLLDLVILSPRPSEDWFDSSKFSAMQVLFNEAKETYGAIRTITNDVLEKYEQEVLTIDCTSILSRFRTDYTSIFKVFKSSYRADKKLIQSYAKNVSVRLTDSSIIELLNELKELQNKKLWISEKGSLMTSLFGKRYIDEYTDWVAFEEAIENFNAIIDWHNEKKVPEKLKLFLIDADHNEELAVIKNQISNELSKGIESTIKILLNLDINVSDSNFDMIVKMIKGLSDTLAELLDTYGKISTENKDNRRCEEILSDLSNLSRCQDIEKQIATQENRLREKYEFYFHGIQTDWDKIICALAWTKEFRLLNATYRLPQSFISAICLSSETAKEATLHGIRIDEQYTGINHEYSFFQSLFYGTKDDFDSMYLPDLSEKLQSCVDNLAELEEWIDFRECREKCNEAGLEQYISEIVEKHINKELIVPVFLKRFYRLWLDAMIEKKPAIASFRRNNFEETVIDFQKHDLNQMKIARLRVKERLASQLPDINRLTSSVDEIGILKRELRKQRKIMPLRKLFAAIPNLLLTIKPCLMMSPLSVSLFLDADTYKFDVIVFDEASQICTEEAVGAIYRGNQVIIAGDDKQLPPTNFFSASKTDVDYDTDNEDEDDDSDAYESVLDEALPVLPERSLLWHYRSRHEDLIAFSNAKIYKNLVTFPSSIEKDHDVGVEYIYVTKGIYDRSGKRDNPVEAQKVADLVFEHFQKFPNRSLGVVTFSSSQQQAVEASIRQRRLFDQRYEEFFSEDRDEAFFIKNLENVQGDERDTIILSIGYAKDSNGIMYMNFGPLTKSGGYRRLNVAITRAKYNLKLVGSIRPTDINADVTSDGAKMLRSYIDFAINGKSAIESELQVPDSVNVESPFEESVYDFLIAKGYNVATQVGCSGFRIDMAIRHPNLSGRFVLGIECDGATYHSARTARERDRLRQTVLENIGWKIYRIWSTDWIKDPITEGRRLVQNVEEALSSYVEDDLSPASESFDPDAQENDNIIEEVYAEEKSSEEINLHITDTELYEFAAYKETNVHEVKRDANDILYCANVLKYVIENEYPIHFELLCKRVACLFGNQKATSKVRNYVNYVLNQKLKDEVIRKGDFCWLANAKDIIVRIPNDECGNRPITYISTEELEEAMYRIADKSFGIKQDDLFVLTARVYGFNRTGDNITLAMLLAMDKLIENKKVEIINDKVTVIKEANSCQT